MTEKEKMKYRVPLMDGYSEAFKQKVVMEVENGILSKDGARYHYGIRGNTRVLDWCRKYGRFRYPKVQSRPMQRHPKEKTPEQRIEELEKALARANVKVATYETMLEVAKEKLGIDIKKKYGMKPSDE
jgi:transposase